MIQLVDENFNELPTLEFRNWIGLPDADLVSHGSFTLLIVCVEFLRLLDDLLEFGVRDAVDVLNNDGFIHAGRLNDAHADLLVFPFFGLGRHKVGFGSRGGFGSGGIFLIFVHFGNKLNGWIIQEVN